MLAFFKNITSQLPDSFIQSNFGLVEYIDGKGQLRPMYEWQKNTLKPEEFLRALNVLKGKHKLIIYKQV